MFQKINLSVARITSDSQIKKRKSYINPKVIKNLTIIGIVFLSFQIQGQTIALADVNIPYCKSTPSVALPELILKEVNTDDFKTGQSEFLLSLNYTGTGTAVFDTNAIITLNSTSTTFTSIIAPGTTPNTFIFTINIANNTVLEELSITGLVLELTNISDNDKFSIDIEPNGIGTIPYSFTANQTVSATFKDHSLSSGTTKVNGTSPTYTYCAGGALPQLSVDGNTYVSSTTGLPNLTYTWQKNAGSGWENILGASNETYTPNPLSETTSFRRKTQTSLPACDEISDPIEIKVTTLAPGSISFDATTPLTTLLICDDTPVTIFSAGDAGSTTGKIFTYAWYSNTAGSEAPITGQNNATLTLTTPQTDYADGTQFYRRASSALCSTIVESNKVTLNLASGITAGNITINGTTATQFRGCSGSAISLDHPFTNTNNYALSYAWEVQQTNGDWQTVSSNPGLNIASLFVGERTYKNLITINGTNCTYESNQVTLIGYGLSAGSISLSNSQSISSQTICNTDLPTIYGDLVPLVTPSDANAVATFAWESQEYDPTTATWGAWTNIATATGADYSLQSSLTATRKYRRKVFLSIDGSTCSVGTAPPISNEITLNYVAPLQGGNTIIENDTLGASGLFLCENFAPLNLAVNNGSDGSGLLLNYQWERSIDGGISWQNISGNGTAPTLNISNILENTDFRRRTTLQGNTCFVYSSIFNVNVNTLSPGAISFSASGNSNTLTLCSGANYPTIFSRVDGTTQYPGKGTIEWLWEQSIDDGTNWTAVAPLSTNPNFPIASGTVTNSVLLRRMAQYTDGTATTACTFKAALAGNTDNVLRIQVLPSISGGTIDVGASVQFICSSGSVPNQLTVTETTTATPLYYQWERFDDISGQWRQLLGENSKSLLFTTTTAPNTTTRYRRGTYNADPQVGNICPAYTSNEAVVNVFSASNGEIRLQDNLLCEAEGTVLDNVQLPISNPAQTISYAWQYTTDDTAAILPQNIVWTTVETDNPSYNTGALSQTTSFRRVERFQNCAETYSNIQKITILPTLEVGTTVGTATEICSGTPGGTLSVTLTNPIPANVFHQWYSRTDPIANYTLIPGAQGLTFDVPNLTETTYFTRETYYAPSRECAVFSPTVVVNVNTLNAGQIGGDTTVCEGTLNIPLGSLIAPASGTAFSVQWQQTTNPANPSAWQDIAGASNNTYTIPLAPSQQTHYRRKITNTSLGCEALSNNVTIDAISYQGNPNIQFASFQNSSTLSFCNGPLPLLIGNQIIPRTNETLIYQWFQSSDNTSWTAITAASGQNYQPTATANIIYYKRQVRISKNGVSCELESNSLEILPANPDFTITAGAIFTTDATGIAGGDTQIICFDTTPNLLKGDASTVKYQGVDQSFTYQWYNSTDNINFQPVSSGTNQNLSITNNLTTTTYFFRATLPNSGTVTCTSISSNRITIVVPENGNLNIQGQRQRVICPGETIQTLTSTRTIGTTELNTLSFQWFENIDNNGWTPISGATDDEYTRPMTTPLTRTTSFKREATYSIDTVGDGTPDCPATGIDSNELTFTVNRAEPGKITYAGNMIDATTAQLCYGAVPEKLITDTADPYSIVGTTAVFQWQTSTDGSNWTNILVTTEDYSPTGLTQTTFFRRLVGSLQSPSNIICWSNPAESNFLKLEVFPELETPILSSTVNLACDTESAPGTISITNFNNDPNVTYTWFSSTDRISWDEVTNAGSSFTGDVLSLPRLAQTTYYQVKAIQYATPTTTCEKSSAILEIPVIAIDAGTIGFQDNSVSDFYYPTCTKANNSIFISSFKGAKPTAPKYEAKIEVFWEGRSPTSSATWQELNVSGISSNSINNTLEVFGTLSSSIFIRRGVRVPTFGGNFCTSYTNSVLIDVIAPITFSSFDPAIFATDASCPGASDGQIRLSGTAVLPPSTTNTQTQRVDLILNGLFEIGNEFTASINGTPYTYTATISDTDLAILSQNIGQLLIDENLANLTITNNSDNTISIESTDADIPFTISTSVTSAKNVRYDNVRYDLEYKRGSRPENTYTWARFINGLIDPSFSNPGTLDLTDIPAGSYELTISNGPACNTVTSPRFIIEEPLPLPGAVTNVTGAVVCENEPLELEVSDASTYTNQTYRWEFSTDNEAWQTLLLAGANVTTPNVTLPAITQSTYYRRVLEFTDTSGNICGTPYLTPSYLVTLNSAEPGDLKALEPIVCIGSIPLNITTDTGVPYNAALYSSFVWERTEDLTGTSPAWLEITGATAEALTFTAPLLNTTKYRRTAVRTISGISCKSVPSNEVTITVRELPIIDNATIASTGLTPVSCFGAMDGAITIDPTTDIQFPVYMGSPAITTALYSWKNLDNPSFSANTASITGLEPGRYQLQVEYDYCSILSNIFTITEPDIFEINAIAQCDNTLNLDISGGSDNYEITLTAPNGQQTLYFSNNTISFKNLISGGTYTVSVDDIGGRSCPPLTETLTVPTDLIIDEATIAVTNSSCFGVNDGRIILNNGGITISGGVAPYNYSWTAPSGATFISQNISGLEPGTYVLSVTDQSGCTASTAASVASVANLEITNKQVTNEFLACNGATNAAIAIQIASDANSAIQINWFKNGTAIDSNVNTIENLGAGSYRVEVTDLNGANPNCKVEDTFEITQPEVFAASLLELTLSSCPDGLGAIASFDIIGGTAPYLYSINNGTQQTLASDFTITDLLSGNYSITITDANQCSEISIPVTVAELEPLAVSIASEGAITPINCNLGGGIAAQISGGTAPYFYIWSGPGYSRTGTDLNTITNLTNAGLYTLTVTDATQCSSAPINVQLTDDSGSFGLDVVVENGNCSITEDGNSIRLNPTGTVTNPFSIQWEIWNKKTDPTCIQDCFEWTPLPNSSGSLTQNNLNAGRYRVSFSDSSTTGCGNIIKIIEIPEPILNIKQTAVTAPTCTTATGAFNFVLEQTNLVDFFLNGNSVTLGDGTLSYSQRTNDYKLSGLASAAYTLSAVERLNTTSGIVAGCQTVVSFIVPEYIPLAYLGETEVEIAICDTTPLFTLNTANIIGGTPFVDDQGQAFYNYTWFGPNNFGITGVTTIPVEEGDYRLEVSDAEGCLTDTIVFTFTNSHEEIQVTSTFIRPSCDGNQQNGAINISINGGKAPYAIIWEKEIIDNQTGNISYEGVATNAIRLNNLGEGRYRLTVKSTFIGCGNLTHPANSFTKIFSLESSDTLSLSDTPLLSDALCKGNSGTITVKLFDTTGTNAAPAFYYDGTLVTGNKISPDTYEVNIETPLDNAILTIVNDFGCELTQEIALGVPDAGFIETSISFEEVGQFITGEPINFTNTTDGDFAYAIWDFGDGTTLEQGPENDFGTVSHTYEFDGLFEPSLRVYNSTGCYTEYFKELTLGKGYQVLFPNAFSPNQDGINDYFEGAFIGFTTINLEVYTPWGALLYAAEYETANTPKNWGWDGNYSNGEPCTQSYFRFVFTGTLPNESVIIKSGEAVIVR